MASELRLWEALDEGEWSPFQYFGVHDDVEPGGSSNGSGGYVASRA